MSNVGRCHCCSGVMPAAVAVMARSLAEPTEGGNRKQPHYRQPRQAARASEPQQLLCLAQHGHQIVAGSHNHLIRLPALHHTHTFFLISLVNLVA